MCLLPPPCLRCVMHTAKVQRSCAWLISPSLLQGTFGIFCTKKSSCNCPSAKLGKDQVSDILPLVSVGLQTSIPVPLVCLTSIGLQATRILPLESQCMRTSLCNSKSKRWLLPVNGRGFCHPFRRQNGQPVIPSVK